MKLFIQLFASLDDLVNTYNEGINKTQEELNSISNEKQTLLDDYNTNYNNQLNKYDSLLEEQKNNINTWAETQKQTQQAQTDYNIGLINQNKAEAQKQTDAELGDAYIDYQKGLNQYGGNAESMATNGLSGTGFAKNADIAMNITYQNRVSTAKAALVKANTDYENQIQQALLNNDASLAEIALQQMQQSYQLALQGFEYKNTLYNNKLSYEQSINDDYFNRSQTLQNRIDTYRSDIANITKLQEEYAMEKQQREQEYQQWKAEFDEKQRQFNASLAEERRQYNKTYNATYNNINGGGFTDTTGDKTPGATAEDQYTYAKAQFGNDASTVNKKDYYFSNGYQPQYLNNVKLSKTGVTVKEVFGDALGSQIGSQNVWNANGTYYYWDGKAKDYVQIDGQALKKLKNAQSWWDKIWHKDI